MKVNLTKLIIRSDIIKKKTNSKDGHKNRGLKWEKVINDKLTEYRKQGLCFIQKIPTEFTIIRNGPKIVSAFPKKQTESVDFIGAKQFLPVALEAKETKNKTSFPINNIETHQIKFLDEWCDKQGVGYYFIRFTTLERIFLIDAITLNKEIHIREQKIEQQRGDKSLTLEWFEQNSIEVGQDMEFLKYIKN